ncbi:ThuA domain-containing protein [bacterium]|nr:ThuA domain-containing protein [bacterium]
MKKAKRIPVFPVLVLSVLSLSSAQAAQQPAWPKEAAQALAKLPAYDYGQPRAPLATLELSIAKASGDPQQKKAIAARLGGILADPKATVAAKRFICQQLLIVGNDSHVPTLAALLDDVKTVDMARRTLEGIPGEASLAALRGALAKLKDTPLVGAINSIGIRRDTQSVPTLAKLLAAKDLAVASAAAEALGRIGTASAADALMALKCPAPLETVIFEATLRCAEALSKGKDPKTGFEIYWKIPLGADAREHRVLAAISGMARAGEARAMPVLLSVLAARSAHPHARAHAMRLAAGMPGEDVTIALSRKLTALESRWQVVLLGVLAERGDRAAAPAVAKLTSTRDAAVQLAAIRALGSLGDARSAQQLARLLAAPEGEVQRAARDGLVRLTGAGVDDALLLAATAGAPATRVQMMRILAARRAESAVPKFLAAAREADESIRVGALSALSVLADARAYPQLLGTLADAPSPSTAIAAERAVVAVARGIDDASARAKPVLAALAKAPSQAKPALLRVLAGCGGPEALAAVRAHLADADKATADAAVRALAKWPDGSAAGDLLKLAQGTQDATHRLLAIRGCLRLAQDAKPQARLKMLDSIRRIAQTADAKRMLLGELGGIADPAALDVAAGFLGDKDVRAEAAMAMVRCGKAVLGTGQAAGRAAVGAAMQKLAQTTKDKAVADQAKALYEESLKTPASPGQQHAALRADRKRSGTYKAALAKRAPKGYRLTAYLDCGPDALDGTKGGPTVRLLSGQAHVWAGGNATAEQLRHVTIFYAGDDVSFEATGLDPKKAYQLGFSWWDYDHNTRAQSVWAGAGKQGKLTRLLARTKLPPGRTAAPAEKTLPLPREVTARGTARIVFRNEAAPNCVVSEVWLWESEAESEAKLPPAPPPRPKGGTPVVILTGIEYPGHPWKQTAPALADLLLKDPRLDVTTLEDPTLAQAAKLRDYKVCVLNYMNWEKPDPPAEALANFQKFVADGGGLVLVHFACGAFQKWPEFVKIAGRVWNPKMRGHDPHGTFRVDMTDVKHPITAGMKPFETLDELYTCLDGKTPITVLAKATSKVDKKDYPMAFVLQYGKGRVFHCVLGHDLRAFQAEAVGELFRRGTAWAAGLAPVAPAK